MWRGMILITATLLGIVSACTPRPSPEPEQVQSSLKTQGTATALQAEPKVSRRYEVYFASDSVDIDAQAASMITSALSSAQATEFIEILLSGHADQVGTAEYNMLVSELRVNRVADVLMEAGVPPNIIKKVFYGETRPRIQTSDGQAEAGNRRVDIEVIELAKTPADPQKVESLSAHSYINST